MTDVAAVTDTPDPGPPVLLVYGSAALALTPEASAWAQGTLAVWLDRLAAGSVVLSGRCPDGGPDVWAQEYVLWSRADLALVEFALDGRVWKQGAPVEPEEGWYDYLGRGAEQDRGTRRWPLRRNEAMATAVKRALRRKRDCRALGLKAPWSTRHGTDHMTKQLGEVPWSVITCPANLGPREATP